MIKKLALATATYFSAKGQYSEESINVYAYGFEILIATIWNAIGLLLLSLLMGVVPESIVFSLALIPLRSTAGGYHTQNHWSCFLSTMIVFVLITLFLQSISYTMLTSYVAFAALVSSVLVWLFSPFRAINNPLKKEQKAIFRKRSLTITTINMAITIIVFFIPHPPMKYLAFYQSGALAASLTLAAAVFDYKYKSRSLNTHHTV